MKRALAIVMVLVVCVGMFAACGGSDDDRILGKWTATTVEGMGMSVSIAEFTQLTGMEMDITFDFKSGGKVTGDAMGVSSTGKYTVDGDTVAVTLDGETVDFTYTDGKLVFELEGFVITLEK